MEKEPLNFKNNACRIDLKVAGDVSKASGFVYITDPFCSYDYVLSAKHAFQEDIKIPPCPNDLRSIVISFLDENGELKPWKMEDKKINESILFIDEYDLAIIKIEKSLPPKAERIIVKNSTEVNTDCIMDAYSFPSIRRNMSTRITYKLIDKYDGLVDCDKIQTISNFDGMSGSGIYLQRKPFLVSVIAGYSLPGFELKQLNLSKIDWDKVNDKLKNRGWVLLDRGDSNKTRITSEQKVIDLRELRINDAVLNMEKAIKFLRHDLEDDWYFDPLHYIDICNAEFVLDYFSLRERREQYKPQKLEEFYLPKRSLVLRKALVGTFIDRLVFMAVVCTLAPTIERNINKFVFSARYDRTKSARGLIVQGVEQWTKMNYLISDWIDSSNSGCLVKLDLLNYYDSINKQKLISLLEKLPLSSNETACIKLLNIWLTSSGKEDDSHGIPQNSDASSLLATFYLSDVDEYIGAVTAQHYCRFMDDMYFIAEDIYKARELMQSIEKKLRQLDLSLNSEKVKFIRLNNKKEKNDFRKELSLFDYDKSRICTLMKSGSKARRMNAVAMLIEQIGKSLTTTKVNRVKEIERNRALKFSINALTSYRLSLDSNWDDFYSRLKKIAVQQVDKPELITYFCRLVGSLNKKRDISDLKEIIIRIVLRKKVHIYDWQAYHLWMLLAYLKCNDPRLISYAAVEIENNNKTRKVEIAAIIIYMATINPNYIKTLLQNINDDLLNGNLQLRCALVACRSLSENVIDDEAQKEHGLPLKDYLRYLHKHKDKNLVLFHRISSYAFERNESVLFPESYSGL